MKYVILICLAGCSNRMNLEAEWHCSQEQMKKVESETTFCIDKKSMSEYGCYRAAIGRNCAP